METLMCLYFMARLAVIWELVDVFCGRIDGSCENNKNIRYFNIRWAFDTKNENILTVLWSWPWFAKSLKRNNSFDGNFAWCKNFQTKAAAKVRASKIETWKSINWTILSGPTQVDWKFMKIRSGSVKLLLFQSQDAWECKKHFNYGLKRRVNQKLRLMNRRYGVNEKKI